MEWTKFTNKKFHRVHHAKDLKGRFDVEEWFDLWGPAWMDKHIFAKRWEQ